MVDAVGDPRDPLPHRLAVAVSPHHPRPRGRPDRPGHTMGREPRRRDLAVAASGPPGLQPRGGCAAGGGAREGRDGGAGGQGVHGCGPGRGGSGPGGAAARRRRNVGDPPGKPAGASAASAASAAAVVKAAVVVAAAMLASRGLRRRARAVYEKEGREGQGEGGGGN
jgi:hypothetical protein